MGVSGSGKTSVGTALAKGLGWGFADADSFHSDESRANIAAGVPLTDQDRQPWLEGLGTVLAASRQGDRGLVLACSALKQRYRDLLRDSDPGVCFVYLRGTREMIAQRLEARSGHFAPASILTSQIATLEEPTDALIVDIHPEVPTIVRTIREGLGL